MERNGTERSAVGCGLRVQSRSERKCDFFSGSPFSDPPSGDGDLSGGGSGVGEGGGGHRDGLRDVGGADVLACAPPRVSAARRQGG